MALTPASGASRNQAAAGFDAVRLSDGSSFYVPVKASDLTPLATTAKQDTAQARLDLLSTEATLAGVKTGTDKIPALVSGRTPVDPSGVTSPISAAALPLPSGAATGAKQDTQQTRLDLLATEAKLEQVRALLAGSLTVSGPLTDTQLRATAVPVSGPLTDAQLRASNVGVTVSNPTTNPETGLAKDATLTGGTVKAIARGGAKGATSAADITSTAQGADHQAQDVQLYHGGAAKDPTQIRALTSADVVTANAGTGPFPVSDNAGSLTVDAPVATPVAARLSDGAAFIDPRDTSDRAGRLLGKVSLTDGTDDATITPVRTLPAATDKALVVREVPNRLSTYAVTIATQTPTITVGVKELLALWHANTGARDIYIVEIWATALITTASTAGRTAIRVSTISSAPTGGSALTPIDVAQAGTSDMTNAMQVKTGGGAIGTTFIRKLAEWATQPVGRVDIPVYQASNPGNGLILPAGSNAGISIDIEREVAHTALVDVWTVGARWIEV